MEFDIITSNEIKEDVIAQLKFLTATPVGTVVCDRDFGINMSFLDKSIPMAENLIASELVDKMAKYIPLITLSKVTFEPQVGGDKLRVKLVIKNA